MSEPPAVPVLETPRLRLRALRESDADARHAAFGDAGTMRFRNAPPARDVDQTAATIRRSLGVGAQWHAVFALTPRVADRVAPVLARRNAMMAGPGCRGAAANASAPACRSPALLPYPRSAPDGTDQANPPGGR